MAEPGHISPEPISVGNGELKLDISFDNSRQDPGQHSEGGSPGSEYYPREPQNFYFYLYSKSDEEN